MKIEENVSLANYSTMRLGGNARYLCHVKNEEDIEAAVKFAAEKQVSIHVVGGGSNSIFSDDGYNGLVVINEITGIELQKSKDETVMEIGAGEKWDDIVAKSVDLCFSDIASLSLIPGSAGAAPVQNIGAYGQQISDCLVSLRAYDIEKNEWKVFLRKSCNFSYRASRFNSEDKNRYIISSIKLRLGRKIEKSPFYFDIENYFKINGINTRSVTPAELRQAVIAIRQAKLPDPEVIANCGSFFKNPVITEDNFRTLSAHYPTLKVHETDDGKMKLYAGQLIELAGLKNYHDKKTGMATWKNQALVLINENAKTTSDLIEFKKMIVSSVHVAFGITLEQEPELVEVVK